MIIKYKDYYTFQRCGINDDSGEILIDEVSMEEL